MVLVEVNGNYINPEPTKNKSKGSMIKAYLVLWNQLTASGTVKSKTQIWIMKGQRNTKRKYEKNAGSN